MLYAHPGESSAPTTRNSFTQTSPDNGPGLKLLSRFTTPADKNLTVVKVGLPFIT